MTIENTTDAYGNELTLINMIDDGEKAHHAIPHQNNASDDARDSDYITADEAAELAGEVACSVDVAVRDKQTANTFACQVFGDEFDRHAGPDE